MIPRTRWQTVCRDCDYRETAPNAYTACTWALAHEDSRGHVVDYSEVSW